MAKNTIMMLIASSVLIAGILVTGCTDNTLSDDTSSTLSAVPTLAHATAPSVGSAEGHVFNESAVQNGTPPSDMQMNGTRPSGTPPEGMQMNGTRPATPPDGMMMNGTRPEGTPPSGPAPSGTPPKS